VEGPLPKHAQLRAILVDLTDNDLSPDAPIPSERELMSRYGVSRATVREAIGQLVSEGRLYRVHGKGTFVGRERVVSPMHLASFTEGMRRRGLNPATLVRSASRQVPQASAQAALGLADNEHAWRIERLRLAGGAPMAVELGWYPVSAFPRLTACDLSGSLYMLFAERYGLVIDRGEQTILAEACERETATLLGVPVGSPVMAFRRTSAAGAADRRAHHLVVPRRPLSAAHDPQPRTRLTPRTGPFSPDVLDPIRAGHRRRS
jgi:GntR family transcriptional regulator